MVQGQQQLVLFVIELDQRDPEQRAILQIERGVCLFFAYLLCTGLALINCQVAEINPLQVKIGTFIDPLHGLPVMLIKARAQGFMAFNQLRKTAAQRGFVEFTAQAQGTGNRIGAAGRVELPHKPQAVLRQRLRQTVLARQRRDLALGQAAILLQCADLCGESAQRRRFKQQAQAQLQLEFFAQAGNHLGGENRVTAQQEEMIIASDLLDLQVLTPDPGNQRFKFGHALCAILFERCIVARRELRVTVETAIGQAIATG